MIARMNAICARVVADSPNLRTRRRPRGPVRVDAVVLKVNEQSARVRILGQEGQVTFLSGDVCDVQPGHLVTLVVERRWTWQGDRCASGGIENPPIDIAKLGLGWGPEDCGIFPDLTVAENIEIATWTRPGGRPAGERIARAYEVFPVLRTYARRKGPQMSGGERKMLCMARALALDPEMLILDEPFEGLSPAIVPVIGESIAAVTRLGHSILLAESNIHHVPEYADRLYVIERGEIIFAGRPHEAWNDPAVVRVVGHGGPATHTPASGGTDPRTPIGGQT